MSDADAFAYFVDPDEMPRLVPDWPDRMRLVFCLDAEGVCEFMVFHDDEEPEILERVGAVLGRAAGGFAVSPDIDGYPRRALKFSEESALLRSVRGAEGLQELATDYLINYAFAREEKIDPQALLSPVLPVDEELELRANVAKIFPMRSRTGAPPRGRPDLPSGYLPGDDASVSKCFHVTGEMWRSGARIRILADAHGNCPDTPVLARELAFRDDFASFYIARGVLSDRWQPEQGFYVDIPSEAFPRGFAESCSRRLARIAVTPSGIFIEPGLPVAEAQTSEADPVPPQVPAIWRYLDAARKLRVLAFAVVGLAATGFLSVMVAQTATAPTGDAAPGIPPSLAVFGGND